MHARDRMGSAWTTDLIFVSFKQTGRVVNSFNVFKYHVSSTDGMISVGVKTEIFFIFRLHRGPIQLVMLVLVGISLKILTSSAGLVGC